MQAGEPFGVLYGDEGIFLATNYDDLTCVVLERVDRIERVTRYHISELLGYRPRMGSVASPDASLCS